MKIIYLIITIVGVLCKPRPKEDKMCIDQNTWDSISNSTKRIGDSTKCTKISSDCCFISIRYKYLNTQIESEYCASLTGKIDDFKKFLYDIYADDLLYYATQTYDNYQMFSQIGRNVPYKYYEVDNRTCMKPMESDNEFSTYLSENCGKFDDQGNCLLKKNDVYFEGFVKEFYKYFTSDYCNKKDQDGKCILYTGAQQNNAMVRPLLLDLIGYLHVEDANYTEDSGNVDQEVDTSKQWPNNSICDDRSPIEIVVTCPENYVKGEWLLFSKNFMIVMIIFLF